MRVPDLSSEPKNSFWDFENIDNTSAVVNKNVVSENFTGNKFLVANNFVKNAVFSTSHMDDELSEIKNLSGLFANNFDELGQLNASSGRNEMFDDEKNVSLKDSENFLIRLNPSKGSKNFTKDSSKVQRLLRGIINPNYPGFQKYAHTLLEYSPTEYYDNEGDEKYNEVCFNNNLKKNSLTSISSEIFVTDSPSAINKLSTNKISNDGSEENILSLETISKSILSNIPDLLLKSCDGCDEKKNHIYPDLLKELNYSLLIVDEERFLSLPYIPLKKRNYNLKNMHSLDIITPVDRVGDFGEELEQEFGLLIFEQKKFENISEPICIDTIKLFDADLSNATESLSDNKTVECKTKQNEQGHDIENIILLANDYNVNSNDKRSRKNYSINSSQNSRLMKFQRHSYDDRQLPPIPIEYNKCSIKKSKRRNQIVLNNRETKKNFNEIQTDQNRVATQKKKNFTNNNIREHEFFQYQDIVNNKEMILKNSRYTKLSSWAKYLENNQSEKLINAGALTSPIALELFDAYKIVGDDDMETLQNRFEMAKEIEKKRRNNRENTRKRLAMEIDLSLESSFTAFPEIRNARLSMENKGYNVTSDSESQSSDSETCPNLSKALSLQKRQPLDSNLRSYVDLRSINLEKTHAIKYNITQSDTNKIDEFFTKQSKLQIELRMALAQSKKMAERKLEIEKQKFGFASITDVIRNALQEVGINLESNKRRVSRQMLSKMNILQLQIIVITLNCHIKKLNNKLVNFLFERDDLQNKQDSILFDMEKIGEFIITKEGELKRTATFLK